jgi:hypothetical protein
MNTPVTHKRIAALKAPKQVSLLLAVARAIAQGVANNPKLFPNPDPTVAVLNTAIDALETAETSVKAGGKSAVSARNQKRADLLTLLGQEKAYVQKMADADIETASETIQAAGFSVKPVTIRAKRVFGVKQGAVTGSVDLLAPSAGHRSSYEWESSADGGKTWQVLPPTLPSKTNVSGLQPGVSYSFRYRPVLKSGAADWSEATSIIVK